MSATAIAANAEKELLSTQTGPNVASTQVTGRYYWELVFSYDNSANKTSSIEYDVEYTKTKRVDSKQFMSNKFNVNTGFKFENEASASMSFDGLGSASDKTSYSYHLDLAYELVKTSETAASISESKTIQKKFKIGPGDKMSIYRLCYDSDAGSQRTDIEASAPLNEDDVTVAMNFSCVKRIVGLGAILATFRNTTPSEENMVEWASIRDNIVKNSDKPGEQRFRSFVESLRKIFPKNSNTVEWSGIRDTCGEIIDDWNRTEKQLLFQKLLNRFTTVKPSRSNTVEWAAIRDLSTRILQDTTQIF